MDDRAEIQNLMARYCELFDEGDIEGYAQLFAHGRFVSSLGATLNGADEIREHVEEGHFVYDGKPGTRHVISNIEIDIDPAGLVATARSYVTVYQALSGFPLQVIWVGGYRDRFEKADGVWQFAERRGVPFLVGDHSRHVRAPLPPTASN